MSTLILELAVAIGHLDFIERFILIGAILGTVLIGVAGIGQLISMRSAAKSEKHRLAREDLEVARAEAEGRLFLRQPRDDIWA